MDEGQALGDLNGIVQLPAPLAAPDDTNILQGVEDEDDVVREPQDEEDAHQSEDEAEGSPRAGHPQRGEDARYAGIAEHHQEEREKETQDVLDDLKDYFPKQVFLPIITGAHDGLVVDVLRDGEEAIRNGEEDGKDPHSHQDEDGFPLCRGAARRASVNDLQVHVQAHAAHKEDTAVEIHGVHGV